MTSRRPIFSVTALLAAGFALLAAGCEPGASAPPAVTPEAVRPAPEGAREEVSHVVIYVDGMT